MPLSVLGVTVIVNSANDPTCTIPRELSAAMERLGKAAVESSLFTNVAETAPNVSSAAYWPLTFPIKPLAEI